MLEMENVTKSFPDGDGTRNIVLDDLGLQIEEGSFVSVEEME